jgi:hypothetical protein
MTGQPRLFSPGSEGMLGELGGRFRPGQEVVHNLEVALGLLGVCHVGAVLEDHPFGPRYAVCTTCTSSGVASSCRPEVRRVGTLISPSRCSMFQSLMTPTTWKLTRSVHRVVDFRILRELRERTPHVVRPRLQPAHVPALEDHHLKGAFYWVTPLSWDFARQPMNVAAPPDVSTGRWSRSWSDSQPLT